MADASALPTTVAELPFFTSGRFPRPDLIGRCRDGKVAYLGAREFLDEVRDVGLGLGTLGMERGHRVALLSESRPEWLVADFAILTGGGVTVPIYPTLSVEQVSFILADSGATIAIASNVAQLAKVLTAAATLPHLRGIVLIDPPAGEGEAIPEAVVTLADLRARGHQQLLDSWGVARGFHDAAKQVRPEDLATIIYTSGTTGEPKGVTLTHGNLISNLAGALNQLDISDEDTGLSFLPLCHSFERMVAYVYLATGVSMVFAESIDTVARDLLVVRPTVMSGVPRVFEKLHARILERGRAATGLKRHIFRWSLGVASRRGRLLAAHRPLPLGLRLSSRVAERVVFQVIRAGVGGRLRYAVSGSAPLSVDLGEWFYGIGLPILEGYGHTETSPVLTLTPLGGVRFGTVGPPLSNVELRIADDGEILARGPNVMAGYLNRPAETSKAVVDGWFHTGDVGQIDEQGYLRITDRKKEIIVTSGGKKIAPLAIETELRSDALIVEAVVVGERRHFPAALIVPDFGVLAARLGVAPEAARGAVNEPQVRALYQGVVDRVNGSLAQFERIKKFQLLGREFTIAAGELTPTMKVKRQVVDRTYGEVIEQMYRDSAT